MSAREMPDGPVRCLEPQALALLRQAFKRFDPLPDVVWAEVRRPWRLRHLAQNAPRLDAYRGEAALAPFAEAV